MNDNDRKGFEGRDERYTLIQIYTWFKCSIQQHENNRNVSIEEDVIVHR